MDMERKLKTFNVKDKLPTENGIYMSQIGSHILAVEFNNGRWLKPGVVAWQENPDPAEVNKNPNSPHQ